MKIICVPGSLPDFSKIRDETIIVLLGPPDTKLVNAAMKTGRTVLWMPLGKAPRDRPMRKLADSAHISKGVNMHYPFINIEKNIGASINMWTEEMEPSQTLALSEKDAIFYHYHNGHSAWFRKGRLVFLGLYPLFRRNERGRYLYESILYPFLLSLGDIKNKRPILNPDVHNVRSGDTISIASGHALAWDGKIFSKNLPIPFVKSPQIIDLKILQKNLNKKIAVQIPVIEKFWEKPATDQREIKKKFMHIKKQLHENYRRLPEEWQKVQNPLFPEKLLAGLFLIFFCLGIISKIQRDRMKVFSWLPACLLMLLMLHRAYPKYDFEFAVLQYRGGGDWYEGLVGVKELMAFIQEHTDLRPKPAPVVVELGDSDLDRFPFLYLTGHGQISFTPNEIKYLRNYLINGGFLYANDDYGLDRSFRKNIKFIFPDKELTLLPNSHSLFKIFFQFPDGTPKIHEHDGSPPQTYAIYHNGRIVVLYTYEADIGDGWAPFQVHKDPPQIRESALKFGANIILYAINY